VNETLPLAHEALRELARPFVERELLELFALHTVDLLALEGEPLPAEVLLGLAFVVQSPLDGHVGIELSEVPARVLAALREQGDGELEGDPLPWPGGDWHARTAACRLVGTLQERRPFVRDGDRLVTHRYADYQARLARRLEALAAAAPPDVLHEASLAEDLATLFPGGGDPPARQPRAALTAALRRFTVISGGPGTGKTTTVRNVLLLLHRQWAKAGRGAPRVALAAPTGKAAVRLRESILAQAANNPFPETSGWLAELRPVTIHRLLGFQPATPTRFRHGLEEPLPYDVVVIDESSMVDLAMMCKLVEAIGDRTRLLLLGDRNQLASVDAGCVLADVTSGLGDGPDPDAPLSPALHAKLGQLLGDAGKKLPAPTEGAPKLGDAIVQLTHSYRVKASPGLLELARRILADRGAEAVELLKQGGALRLLAREEEEGHLGAEALEALTSGLADFVSLVVAESPTAPLEAHHRAILRAFDQQRILTPHRRGRLGVEGLNRAVLARLCDEQHGKSALSASRTFFVGRPILIRQNDRELGLMNGDVGVVVKVAKGERRVAFPAEEPDRVKYVHPAQLPPHETCFAMTVHKSQGSEYEHALVVHPEKATQLLSRELLYTAVTRARSKVTVIGAANVFREGVARPIGRASTLDRRLWPPSTHT